MSLGLGVGFYGLGGSDVVSKLSPIGIAAGNLAMWLQFDTGITSNESDEVSKWNDQSGNNRHASQGTDANKAALSNGALDFERDNSDHYDFTKIDIADNGGFCVAVVVTRESDTSGCLLSDNASELFQINNTSTLRVKTRNNTTATDTTTDAVFESGTFPTSTKFLLLVNRTAGAANRFTFFKNGTQLTPDTDNSTNEANGENPSGIEFSVLGSKAGSTNYFDGLVHDVAVWDTSLSTQQIVDVNNYFKEIHNL